MSGVTVWNHGTVHPTGGYDSIHEGEWGRSYRLNGALHREDGPAAESPRFEHYYYRGERHRVDGPAMYDCIDGSVEWWLHGQRHRLDGPAIAWADGVNTQWWVWGKRISKEEFDTVRESLDAGTPEEWVRAYLAGSITR